MFHAQGFSRPWQPGGGSYSSVPLGKARHCPSAGSRTLRLSKATPVNRLSFPRPRGGRKGTFRTRCFTAAAFRRIRREPDRVVRTDPGSNRLLHGRSNTPRQDRSQEIILKRTTTRNMATAGRISGTVIQALRHLGARQIGNQHIAHLRHALAASEKAQLNKDRMYAPGWMHRLIDAIVEDSRA